MKVFGLSPIVAGSLLGVSVCVVLFNLYRHFRKRPIDHTTTLSETWKASNQNDLW
jgi:hypothetical protein